MNTRRVAALLRELADERRHLLVYGETDADRARKLVWATDGRFGDWLIEFRKEQRAAAVRERADHEKMDGNYRGMSDYDLATDFDEFGELIDEADLALDISGETPNAIDKALVSLEREDLFADLAMAVDYYIGCAGRHVLGQPCEPKRTAHRPPAAKQPVQRVAERPGGDDVYFVQQGIGGPIKIGKAGDVNARIRCLQTSNPYPLRLLAQMRSVGSTMERELHARFAAHRIQGEWFAPAEDILAFIASISGGAS